MVSPVSHRIAIPLLAASLLAFYGLSSDRETLVAEPVGLFDDSDGDFVPDSVEWVLLTDPLDADSDDDGVSDYIEAVQGGYPISPDAEPLPADDEMRVVATTRLDDRGESMIWVHVMFRLMNGMSTRLTNVEPWIDMEGTKYPMPDLFTGTPLFWRVAEQEDQGTVVILSSPVASEQTGRNLLPFSFGISATLGGRPVSSSAHYRDLGGQTSVLAPIDRDRAAMQSLRNAQEEGPIDYANRVCAVQLMLVGQGPGGLVVQVVSARCEPAHGLKCSSACSMTSETTMVLPDGMATITGR